MTVAKTGVIKVNPDVIAVTYFSLVEEPAITWRQNLFLERQNRGATNLATY